MSECLIGEPCSPDGDSFGETIIFVKDGNTIYTLTTSSIELLPDVYEEVESYLDGDHLIIIFTGSTGAVVLVNVKTMKSQLLAQTTDETIVQSIQNGIVILDYGNPMIKEYSTEVEYNIEKNV